MTPADSRSPHKPLAAPNFSEPRYVVAQEADSSAPGWWLERDGRQLLAGPQAVLETFSDLLNLLDPPERVLPDVVRAMIQMTQGNAFTVGEYLRRLGRRAA